MANPASSQSGGKPGVLCWRNIIGADGAGIVYGGGSGLYHGDGKVLVDPDEGLGEQRILTQTLDLAELETLRRGFPVALDADEFKLV
jgi:predicted amidohydrolase